MGKLYDFLEKKLEKTGRRWEPGKTSNDHRRAELFCVDCGDSLGEHDIANTDLTSVKYCSRCAERFINLTPYDIEIGTIKEDWGNEVLLKYKDNYYEMLQLKKTCYFSKQGRYIKYKGKRYYLNKES